MSDSDRREAKESPRGIGQDETIAFTIDTSVWPGSGTVSAIVNALKDTDGGAVAGGLSGTASVSTDTITTQAVVGSALTVGDHYRMETKYTKSGNTMETFQYIDGET